MALVQELYSAVDGRLVQFYCDLIKDAHSYRWPFAVWRVYCPLSVTQTSHTANALYTNYYRTGGVTGGDSIVYEFYALAAWWIVHAKIDG